MASNLVTTPRADQPGGVADKPEGPVAAAILAAGIGAFALGLLVTLAEASKGLSDALNVYKPVGPLSGKTIVATGVWIVSWVVLHVIYRDKEVETRKVLTATVILIGLGVLGTFPIFFQLFSPQ